MRNGTGASALGYDVDCSETIGNRFVQNLQGKRVTVAGLGHFGGQVFAAARWLVEQGGCTCSSPIMPLPTNC